jgi:hypothetical protein
MCPIPSWPSPQAEGLAWTSVKQIPEWVVFIRIEVGGRDLVGDFRV